MHCCEHLGVYVHQPTFSFFMHRLHCNGKQLHPAHNKSQLSSFFLPSTDTKPRWRLLFLYFFNGVQAFCNSQVCSPVDRPKCKAAAIWTSSSHQLISWLIHLTQSECFTGSHTCRRKRVRHDPVKGMEQECSVWDLFLVLLASKLNNSHLLCFW